MESRTIYEALCELVDDLFHSALLVSSNISNYLVAA